MSNEVDSGTEASAAKDGRPAKDIGDHPLPVGKRFTVKVATALAIVLGFGSLLWSYALEPMLDRMIQKQVEAKAEQQIGKAIAEKSANLDRAMELYNAHVVVALTPKDQQDTEAADLFRKMARKYPNGFDVEFSDSFVLAGLGAVVNSPNPVAYETEVAFAKRFYSKPNTPKFTALMGVYGLRCGHLADARRDLTSVLRTVDSRSPGVRYSALFYLAVVKLIEGNPDEAFHLFREADGQGWPTSFDVCLEMLHNNTYNFFPVGFNFDDRKYVESRDKLEKQITAELDLLKKRIPPKGINDGPGK